MKRETVEGEAETKEERRGQETEIEDVVGGFFLF